MYTNFCRKLHVAFQNLKDDARGVSAIEYAILAAVVIVAVAAGVSGFGNSITNLFDAAQNGLNVAENASGS
ncbi:Flp family type IVb pilin [Castellaniella sp.]|uniref:Flp family type IVb pilin n=1 Tax=Castellaniella sp. TaxID=1955812 RepID=UPI002AFE672D|nr:Flp family type IVb pilin [Castellaniella sp.]